MKQKTLLLLICITIIFQLSVPVYMIAVELGTLKSGASYKIKVGPVDPYDAFRGRYVAIRPDDAALFRCEPYTGQSNIVYAALAEDEAGFAYVTALTESPPVHSDYIKGSVNYGGYINFPIERYYMDEKLAPAAEQAYQNRSEGQDFYILLRVKDGHCVIEGLFVDGIAIEIYLTQN